MKEMLWIGELHGSYEIFQEDNEIKIYNIQGPMQERVLKLSLKLESTNAPTQAISEA